jgi:ferredoxin
LYANQNPDSVIYRKELDDLVVNHSDRLSLQYHFDSDGGHLEEETIARFVHHEGIAEFYLCGPEPFMELIERTLADAGIHEELIYIERFVSPAYPDRTAGLERDFTSTEVPESFSLWLHGRSRTVPYVRGRTLLECAQAAGLNPAHSCESGFCGSCMAAVKTGKVSMRTHEALSDRDVGRGVALLCQSFPVSAEPLELDGDSTSFRAASAVKSSMTKTWSRLAAVAVFGLMVAGTVVLRWVQ